MVKYYVAGRNLLTWLICTETSEGPIIRANDDAFLNLYGQLSYLDFHTRVLICATAIRLCQNQPEAACVILCKTRGSMSVCVALRST